MSKETVLTNAKLIMKEEVINGSVLIKDGLIADICQSNSQLPQAKDLDQEYLMPGMVELHTDNQEKYFTLGRKLTGQVTWRWQRTMPNW